MACNEAKANVLLTKANIRCSERLVSPRLPRITAEPKAGRKVRIKKGHSLIKVYELAKKLQFLKSIIFIKRPSIFFFVVNEDCK